MTFRFTLAKFVQVKIAGRAEKRTLW